MWFIYILIAILILVITIFYLIIKDNKPNEDDNLKYLKTLQRRPNDILDTDQTLSILGGNSELKSKSSMMNKQAFNNKYILVYDCAYDFEEYPFEIVGEASYQSNIKRFADLQNGKSCFTEIKASITREPNNSFDKNACRVEIEGYTIGYFSRNDALSWVRLLKKLNISDDDRVLVDAVIVGGGSDEYKLGVRLNIPTRIANSYKYIEEA